MRTGGAEGAEVVGAPQVGGSISHCLGVQMAFVRPATVEFKHAYVVDGRGAKNPIYVRPAGGIVAGMHAGGDLPDLNTHAHTCTRTCVQT